MKKNIFDFSAILKDRFKRNAGLMNSIAAGQAGNAFKEAVKSMPELSGSRFIWYKNGTLKIQAGSSTQRQELIFKKETIIEEMKRNKVEVKKVEVVY